MIPNLSANRMSAILKYCKSNKLTEEQIYCFEGFEYVYLLVFLTVRGLYNYCRTANFHVLVILTNLTNEKNSLKLQLVNVSSQNCQKRNRAIIGEI